MLGEIAEGHQEFVVDGSGIISDGSNELLDAEFSGVFKQRAAGSFRGVLNLCSMDDMSVTVRGVLLFIGGGVVEFGA